MRRGLLALFAFLVVGIVPTNIDAQAKKPWAPPKSGVWSVKATDEGNTDWTGR